MKTYIKQFMDKYYVVAKQYHCKVITSSDFNEYSFPVFRSKKNAERFKTAIDTLLVLKNS